MDLLGDGMIVIVDQDRTLSLAVKTPVGDEVIIILQHFQGTGTQFLVFTAQADNILVKRQQHLILMSPGIGSPVIRIRESADTGFISVVDRRCARPGHLDHNALPEHCLIDALLRSLGA